MKRPQKGQPGPQSFHRSQSQSQALSNVDGKESKKKVSYGVMLARQRRRSTTYDTYDTNELMYQTETDSGFENELAVARGGKLRGRNTYGV